MTQVEHLNGFYCTKILPLVYDESLSYMELNCKVVAKLNEVIDQIDGLSLEVLNQAKAYTDEAIANQQVAIDEKVVELEQLIDDTAEIFNHQLAEVQSQYNQFTERVNAMLTIYENKLNALDTKIDASIIGVNARTDLAIEQNNEYIFSTIQDKLPTELKVVNFFTGEKISIQAMFNYLANLHVDDGATINFIRQQNKTVNNVVGFNETCTNYVLHGRTIFA